jgi:peptidoglycan L-alanyl-D-glutamate endopeptidase CwlK
MINSRSLNELVPIVKQKVEELIALCNDEGIDLLVTSTYRDNESQAALYAQGRTAMGHIVTNANAGDSFHNYRCAVDVVPLKNGKPVWGTKGDDGELWQKIGKIGEGVGLEWAGNWRTFKELAHFQFTNGHTLAQLKQGAQIV